MKTWRGNGWAVLLGLALVWAGGGARGRGADLELTVQSRDPATGEIVVGTERVDPRRVGVIAVDVWNYHWCKTATMRVDALVPRIDKALEAARQLGMTVMLCPSDVVENYVGYPQRERVLALSLETVPHLVDVVCPAAPDAGGCACGTERCLVNYGWDAMHPALRLGAEDWMPDTEAEVYTLCRRKGLTHLIYLGFHTQVCLLGKPMGLQAMKSAGLRCLLARDLTDAHPGYDPARGFTPDLNTAQVIAHFERYLAPTLSFEKELTKLGRWNTNWVLDPVRLAPWGTRQRPHLFAGSVTVTLNAPFQPDAEIHYTLDGTPPGAQSLRYTAPLVFTNSARVRTIAWRDGHAAGRESEGVFAHLDAPPPAPEVYLGELSPVRSVGFGHSYGGKVRYSGNTGPPLADKANLGGPLAIALTNYSHGLGVHAPNEVVYEVKPEFAQFVGLAGVDDQVLGNSSGSNLAQYPSIVFKVLLDGRQAAASPVMRALVAPWRFSVALPPGTRKVSLVAMNAGDGSWEDFGDWVDAGFTLRH